MSSYIVASIGAWNREYFASQIDQLTGDWYFCSSPEELNTLLLEQTPRYIFFPHWRWLVPDSITQRYECVCFHMTDVPYGRGGSPLQNLIVRGHKETKLSALRMVTEADAGPVYCKHPLDLSGSAQAIYQRATEQTWDIIHYITRHEPEAIPQSGPVVAFSRRTPEQSLLPEGLTSEQVYDYIRMLDADGYPHAFLQTNGYKLSFTAANFDNDEQVSAKVVIEPIKEAK